MNRYVRSLLAASAIAGCSPAEALPTPGRTGTVTEQIGVVASSTTAGFELKGTLSRGRGIALDDHRMALIDGEAKQIAVIDTNGHISLRLGKTGWGAGQFMYPAFAVQADSGIAVFDGLRTEFVRFDGRGRPKKDTPQFDAIGIPSWGGFSGMAQLSDGSWVFSVTGIPSPENGRAQHALYHRAAGTTRLIAATPIAPSRHLRFDCGAGLIGQLPVFWPTLRWAAAGSKVVYASTDADRIVVWDAETNDSTVIVGTASPRRSTQDAALAVTESVTIQSPAQRCTMEKEEVLRQRGTAERMPVIQSVAMASDGTIWVALTTLPGEPSFIRVHRGAATDTIIGGTFPNAFLTPTRFLAEQTDTTGQSIITLWDIRSNH